MNVFVPVVYHHRRNNWPICVLYFAFSLFYSITTTISISTMCSCYTIERHSRRRKLHLFPRLYISTSAQSLRQQDLLFKVRSSLPWLLSRFFSFFLFKTKINRQQRQTRKRSLTLSLSLWWRKSLRRFITTTTVRTFKNPNLQNSVFFFFCFVFLRKRSWLLRSLMFTSYKYKHIFLQGGKKNI